MFRLSDFFHLPALDDAVAQLVADGPGLIVVAGLDARPAAADGTRAALPSGRSTLFRVLLGEILAANPTARAAVVAEDPDSIRLPRSATLPHRYGQRPPRGRAQLSLADRIALAAERKPDLLVVDRLTPETAPAAAAAAQGGIRVIAQLDSFFHGVAAGRHLLELGVTPEQLECLRWVVFVQRLAALCPSCRRPVAPTATQLAMLFPDMPEPAPPSFFSAPGCAACGGSGRQGDVALFDFFCFPDSRRVAAADPRVLPLARYARELAAAGYLSLDDALYLEDDQLRSASQLLASSEQRLADANAALERKVVELENANRVLRQRTEELISLHDIGQTLFATTEIQDLAARIWRHARQLCGADRAILYWHRDGDTAEVLTTSGWDASRVPRLLPASEVFSGDASGAATHFPAWPPGITPRHADVEGGEIRAGLRVPLVSQGRQIGVLFVHSTRKKRFTPGEVALIQTFASQAALALQRAELFAQLREKIEQLEAAQAALVERERLEREMELAREVQQSVLPRVFPALPGFVFAARNQPARQVGGDLYDIFALDEGHVGIVIADVSGKGMPAALYMTLTRSVLFAEARRDPSPRAVLMNVNRLLRELGEPHMFVTVFYGVIDHAARRLTYARAGHDYPLLFRDDAQIVLDAHGAMLGCFDQAELRLVEAQVDLAAGDRLVLYTDGLTDVQNARRERFELERLTATLRAHAALPPEAMCEATFAELAAFQGAAPQYDDMTMLVVAVEQGA